ncbi:MAG: VCBS repeat-containing protein [Myxococcota bacterium]
MRERASLVVMLTVGCGPSVVLEPMGDGTGTGTAPGTSTGAIADVSTSDAPNDSGPPDAEVTGAEVSGEPPEPLVPCFVATEASFPEGQRFYGEGQFDGKGALDVISGNLAPLNPWDFSAWMYFPREPDGLFVQGPTYTGPSLVFRTWADVDADGLDDMVGGYLQHMSWQRNTGAEFVAMPASDLSVDDAPWALLDYDQDQRIDVVTADGIELRTHHGVGDGTWTLVDTLAVSETGGWSSIAQVHTADDLRSGIMLLRECSGCAGTGLAAFSVDETGTIVPGSGLVADPGFQVLSAADFEGDGHADLLIARWQPGSESPDVHVYRVDGSPDPAFSVLDAEQVRVGDFDGDGLTDLLTIDVGGETSQLHLNVGDATFETWPVSLPTVATIFGDLLPADLDGDGQRELLMREVLDAGNEAHWVIDLEYCR